MKVHRLGWITTYTDRHEEMRTFFADVLGIPINVDEGTFIQLGPMADADHDDVEVLSTADPDSAFEAANFTGPPSSDLPGSVESTEGRCTIGCDGG